MVIIDFCGILNDVFSEFSEQVLFLWLDCSKEIWAPMTQVAALSEKQKKQLFSDQNFRAACEILQKYSYLEASECR